MNIKHTLPTLYSRDTKQRIKTFVAEVDGSCFTTYSGLEFGKKTPAQTYCVGKNLGRANATTPDQQAEKEALAKWELKKKDGYRETIEESDLAPKLPNLCQDFKDSGHNMEYPAQTGPKLNGMRVMAVRAKAAFGEVGYFEGFSRKLNPVIMPEHVQAKLLAMPILPNIIDGEFYIHGWHLQDIISLVKRPFEYVNGKGGKWSDVIRKDYKLLQFRLFDLPHQTAISSVRQKHLGMLATRYLKVWQGSSVEFVPAFLVNSEYELKEYRDKFVAEGYEGSVTRACNGTYDWGSKTRTMMKDKPFQDAEFKIIQIVPDKDGLAVAVCETKKGQPFKASFEGRAGFNNNTEYRRYIMHAPERFVGKQATIRFQDYSKDGIPTIGNTIQAIRNYE